MLLLNCFILLPFRNVKKIVSGKQNLKVRLREKLKHVLPAGVCGVRNSVTDPCWLCAVSQEIAEELGMLSSDSSEE